MIRSVTAGVTVCDVSVPPTHTAGRTVGATGVTAAHVVPTRFTVSRAVTRSTCNQPSGIWPHSNPSANVAATVTAVSTVPLYGPAGATTYETPGGVVASTIV